MSRLGKKRKKPGQKPADGVRAVSMGRSGLGSRFGLAAGRFHGMDKNHGRHRHKQQQERQNQDRDSTHAPTYAAHCAAICALHGPTHSSCSLRFHAHQTLIFPPESRERGLGPDAIKARHGPAEKEVSCGLSRSNTHKQNTNMHPEAQRCAKNCITQVTCLRVMIPEQTQRRWTALCR